MKILASIILSELYMDMCFPTNKIIAFEEFVTGIGSHFYRYNWCVILQIAANQLISVNLCSCGG